MEDMSVDLNCKEVYDSQIRVEALGQPLCKVFLQRHVELGIPVYHVLEPLQAVAEISPLPRPFEKSVYVLEL